jgi:DNA-directed RNA polymerase subunit RPC12/RpoP
MGEIPKSIQVNFGNEAPTIMTVYGCYQCQKSFAVEQDVPEHMPYCPICGSNRDVVMVEELT